MIFLLKDKKNYKAKKTRYFEVCNIYSTKTYDNNITTAGRGKWKYTVLIFLHYM